MKFLDIFPLLMVAITIILAIIIIFAIEFIILIIGFIILIIGTIIIGERGLDEIEIEKECYDKLENEIINQTCIDKNICAKNTKLTIYPKCSVLEGRFALSKNQESNNSHLAGNQLSKAKREVNQKETQLKSFDNASPDDAFSMNDALEEKEE